MSMHTRRQFMAGSMLAAACTAMPRLLLAAADTGRRFVFIIQRGAADGLATIMPTGDPDLARLRAGLSAEGGTRLDSMFTAHPELVAISDLYQQREALFAHAIATPYRDRSHFDAQNVLETGGPKPYHLNDGWLNRLLTLLPTSAAQALALAATIPVALRGAVEVGSYAPSNLPEARDDLKSRVAMLYESDPLLHELWQQALATQAMAGDGAGAKRDPAALGALAARMLGSGGAARVAMIETLGWDTHFGQTGRLAKELKGLDALIAALRAGLGDLWRQTIVLVATEFGRTAAANGTGGTDHGTASAAMLIGGAVQGGRVIADWPGLGAGELYQGRDLRPTMSLNHLIASALAGHYGLDPALVGAALFPGVPTMQPAITGLIRA